MSGISRRQLLEGVGAGGLGLLYPGSAALAKSPNGDPRARQAMDCYGLHQAGVTTAMQHRLELAAFDVVSGSAAELRDLLRSWQHAIELLTAGTQLSAAETLDQPPTDTGEAVGQGPAQLTITIGFGGSLFDDRFGLASRRPPALVDVPPFPGDQLDASRSDGDISVQACADTRLAAEHAIRNLARLGAGVVRRRWQQSGFDEPPVRPAGTGRNLLAFKDGTANLDPTDDARMRRNVWAASGDGPSWMAGGTYQVYRRVRLRISEWDESPLGEQQDVFGRYRANGAPYGGTRENDPVDTSRLPATSHVRLANPRTGQDSEDERILRRGYSFHDGWDAQADDVDAGLAFIAYQRDPRRQFITIQQRLADNDALNEYLTHTAGGIFAIPPGVRRGGHLGSQLLEH